MTADMFRLREQALEYEFYHQVDERLWRELRERLRFDERRRALADATGITEDSVLSELVELDIRSETIFALSLFPLVWLAWADGRIEPPEREAILDAAHATGHERDKASHRLIETWLDHRPDSKLQTAWKDYVHVVCRTVSPEARESLKSDMLERARNVADAVNARYGEHGVESTKEAILDEIARAFDVG